MLDFIRSLTDGQFVAFVIAVICGLMTVLQIASARRGATWIWWLPLLGALIYLLVSLR